uniref:G_PROTEIN_RECEP_F1_2 domain-containing protein n=1 Tax=Meloidogyne incognita TaxID=6306 RepID=A0A914LLK5_MELIC
MWTYFLFHLFCTFTCLAYPICEFIRWKSLDETIRTGDLRSPEEQIVLFWTGIWQLNYFACAPIATFILMLDRCLILWSTARNFNKYFEILFKWMGLCCLILCYLISLILYLSELPLNRTLTQTCRYVDCLMTVYQNRFQLFIKNMFGFANLICCIVFFWSLKHFASQSQSSARILKNRMVKFAIYMEILFEVIPGAFSIFLNLESFCNH